MAGGHSYRRPLLVKYVPRRFSTRHRLITALKRLNTPRDCNEHSTAMLLVHTVRKHRLTRARLPVRVYARPSFWALSLQGAVLVSFWVFATTPWPHSVRR